MSTCARSRPKNFKCIMIGRLPKDAYGDDYINVVGIDFSGLLVLQAQHQPNTRWSRCIKIMVAYVVKGGKAIKIDACTKCSSAGTKCSACNGSKLNVKHMHAVDGDVSHSCYASCSCTPAMKCEPQPLPTQCQHPYCLTQQQFVHSTAAICMGVCGSTFH